MTKKSLAGTALMLGLLLMGILYISCGKENPVDCNNCSTPDSLAMLAVENITVQNGMTLYNSDTVGAHLTWYGSPGGLKWFTARMWEHGNLCFHSLDGGSHPVLWLGQNRRVGIALEGREPLKTLDVNGDTYFNGYVTVNRTNPRSELDVHGGISAFRLRVYGDEVNYHEIRHKTDGSMEIRPIPAPIGAGRVHVTGELTAINCCSSSDSRWKTNISPLSGSLQKISDLTGVNFEWRTEEFPNQGFGPGRNIGLIAQDVERVFPEVVTQDKEGYRFIAYDKLVPVLIEAVKEQQAFIKQQSTQLELQSTALDMLAERISQLESAVSREPVASK